MSAREFAEWIAYAGIAPFGEDRADLRSATIAALIAEVNRDRKRRSRPYSPADFMPDFEIATSQAPRNKGGAEIATSGSSRGIATSGSPRSARDSSSQQARDDKVAELWANLKLWAMRAKDAQKVN